MKNEQNSIWNCENEGERENGKKKLIENDRHRERK
jgi:hypothetical protein